MGEVIKFYHANAAENPDAVLEQAVGKYEAVFIIGHGHDGQLDVRSSTNISAERTLFLIELFKHKLLNGDYHEVQQ